MLSKNQLNNLPTSTRHFPLTVKTLWGLGGKRKKIMSFKIGEKVICIKNHSEGIVLKGEEHIVNGYGCCDCNTITLESVYYGVDIQNKICRCQHCNTRGMTGKNWELDVSLFRKASRQKRKSNAITQKLVKIQIIEERSDIPQRVLLD